MSKQISDPFWTDNISVLFDSNKLVEFYPTPDMTYEEKLNSLLRFSAYLGFIVSIYKKDIKYMAIPAFYACFSILVYEYRDIKEGLDDRKCVRPTSDNPFMNVLPMDYIDNPTRGPACNVMDPEVKKEIDKYIDNDIYKDVNDPFDNENSQRQFYTMPNTTIPHDTEDFNKWICGIDETCKDNNKCNTYDDLRRTVPLQVYEDPRERAKLQLDMSSTRNAPVRFGGR